MSDEPEMRTRVLPVRQRPRIPSAWKVLAETVLKAPRGAKEHRERLEAARSLARLVLEEDNEQ